MSAFDIIRVRVLTPVRVKIDEFGDRPSVPADIPGSPFQARIYRASSGYQRKEEAAGTATIQARRVLSFVDPSAADGNSVSALDAVKNGMTAVIPPCSQNGNTEERVSIQNVRRYGPSVQCDLFDTIGTPK